MLVHHLLLTKYLERIPRQYTEPKSAERVWVRLYYRKCNAVTAVHAGLPEGFRQDASDRLHLEFGGGSKKGEKKHNVGGRGKQEQGRGRPKNGAAPGS